MAIDICLELMNQGHEVKLVTLHAENEYNFLTKKIDHQIAKTSLKLSIIRKNQVDVVALQTIIDSFQPEVIHSHLFEAEINLAFCHFPKGAKRVVHFHNKMVQFENILSKTKFNRQKFTNYFEKRILLSSYPKNTEFVAISSENLSNLKRVLPDKYRAQLLPNAIDLKRFVPKEERFSDLANEISTIGSLIDVKGHDLALETVHELKKRNVECLLHIIGDGTNRKKLEAMASTLQIEKQIEFHGSIDYPELILQKSKLYLHTSKSESFGLALIEAMACGLPVITTDGNGNRDLIQEGKNGFMVMKRDSELIADKIEILLNNNSLSKNMSENASRFASKFGLIEYISKLLIIYNNSF